MATNNKGRKRFEDYSKEELVELVKRLKRQKKYGLVWEDKPEDVVEQCRSEIPVLEQVTKRAMKKAPGEPTNLIIEGDNYHALSVLNYTHAGKIDVIYIDPPFNTGARDWKYNNDYVDINDTFRHSKWLSMMHNRLAIAKSLLAPEGVLICAVDDNEQAHLGVLLEELFPERERHCVTIIHNPRGVQGTNFSYTHEYAYFVIPAGIRSVLETQIPEEDREATNLRNWGGESLRTDAKNCFYPIFMTVGAKFIKAGEVPKDSFHPRFQFKKRQNGVIEFWPVDDKGVERKWRYARQSIDNVKHLLTLKKVKQKYEIQICKPTEKTRTVWSSPRYDAGTYGTRLLRAMVPKCDFSFPKSLWTIYDCLYVVIGNKKDAIVLDYFAGSGTTGHSVLKLNQADAGHRQFILATNNENRIAETCTLPRIKAAITGFKGERGTRANLRYFKTAFIRKNNVSDDTRRELVSRSTDMICVRENTFDKKHDSKQYKIYSNGKVSTGILFDLDAIKDFKARLASLKSPAHIYVFSLTDDVFADDFADLKVKHKLCPIPESILEVYRKLSA